VAIRKEAAEVVNSTANKIDIGNLSINEAIDWLQKKAKEEETVVSFFEEFSPYHAYDALVSFRRALDEIYGWVDDVAMKTFFGPRPPQMIPIKVSFTETVHVPHGQIKIPKLSGFLNTAFDDGKLIIHGEFKKKEIPELKKIAALTRENLKTGSIYKGKAIKIGDDGFETPEFLDLSGVREGELVFSKHVQDQLESKLWTLLEHTKHHQKYQVPFGQGVLLTGKYGTGKTLAALITAHKAQQNGVTFLQLKHANQLPQALIFIKPYTKAVVFVEDLDRIAGGQRDAKLDNLMNTFDGMDSKSDELIKLATTNNEEIIHPGMLRHGRFNSIIWVTPPDAEAAIRLVRIYGRELIDAKEDLTEVGEELNGKIPAMIRGVVETAKMATINRLARVQPNGHVVKLEGQVTAEDLLIAARGEADHEALVNRKPVSGVKEVGVHLWFDGEKLTGNTNKEQFDKLHPQVQMSTANQHAGD